MTIPEFPELVKSRGTTWYASIESGDFSGLIHVYDSVKVFTWEVEVDYVPSNLQIREVDLVFHQVSSTREKALTQAREAWQTAWHTVFNLAGLVTMDQMNGVDELIG